MQKLFKLMLVSLLLLFVQYKVFGQFYNFKHYNVENGFPQANGDCIIQDHLGYLWIATQVGAVQFDGYEYFILNNEKGLSDNIVHNLYQAHDTKLWIGTKNGLCVYDYDTVLIVKNEGLATANILGIWEDNMNRLWVASESNLYVNKNGNFEKTSFPLFRKRVFCSTKYEEQIFLGTNKGVIIQKNEKFYEFEFNDQVGKYSIRDIAVDEQGNYWLATGKEGLINISGNTIQILNEENGFVSNIVDVLLCDSYNNIWIGTEGKGVIKFDGSSYTHYTDRNGMNNTSVLSLLEDKEQNIWVGGRNGIVMFNPNNPFIHYPNANKSSKESVFGMTEDRKGNFWFTTYGNGISKYDGNKFTYFDESDGIGDNRFFDVIEDSPGDLWFASLIGVSKYIPGIEKKNTEPPATHITSIDLFYKETSWEQYSDSLGYRGLPVSLNLPQNKNHLTFQYTGICFTNPAKVRYKFKLEGLDEHWSPVTSKREAVYANIPPGDYVFNVKAMNNDGVWNSNPTKFAFSVQPPFWQTTIFIMASIVFLLLSVFIYIRLRIRNLRKSKQRLAYRVQERTKELLIQKKEIEEKNEELGQVNEELNAQKAEIIAQRDLVETQKNTLERTYKQVTDSILYAEKIQRAVMPSEEYLDSLFPGHFVFYKPLHIVSGDFYWVIKKEHMLLFAVADCTGHGVPGGFMSMLGVALITDIVNKPYVNHPDIALNQLRENIIRSLRQKGITGEQKDGMDIALCALNTQNMELEYAGANNPIYLSTNLDSAKKMHSDYPSKIKIHYYNTCTLVEIIPDKMPIAIFENMNNFSRITLQLQKDDMLYLFSDGYLDQFGGPKSRKYTRDSFKELIASVTNENTNKQLHTIEGAFFEWKGTHKQVDDILVMGIRVG